MNATRQTRRKAWRAAQTWNEGLRLYAGRYAMEFMSGVTPANAGCSRAVRPCAVQWSARLHSMCQRATGGVRAPQCVDEKDPRFQERCGCLPDGRRGSPSCGKAPSPNLRRSGRAESSRLGKDLIANKMQTNPGRPLRTVKVEGGHRLLHMPAQRLPVIGFGENALGQALRHKASVAFLGNLENNLIHAVQLTALRTQ